MTGTMRTFHKRIQEDVKLRLRNTVASIAQASGGTAVVHIIDSYPLVYNDPCLLKNMLPIMKSVFGKEHLHVSPLATACEDFGYFAQEIPGLFLFLGACPENVSPQQAAPNHSPYFEVNEASLSQGVKLLSNLAVGFLMELGKT